MEQAKHTPGPWRFGEFELYPGADLRFNISQAEGAQYTPHYSDVAVTIAGERKSIQEANARLIAAAPDLLATLSQIERLSREADGNLVNVRSMLGDIARAAITRATKGD